MRGADRSGGEDDLAIGIDALHRAAALIFDCDGAAAIEQEAPHQSLGDDLQVRALHRRAQIGTGGACPSPAAARLLAPADAVAGAGRQVVHVLAVLEADFLAGLDYRRAERRPVHLRCKQRTTLAANLALAALPILGLFEIREHVVPRPAAIAELGPMVEIFGLAANVDQSVYRARPAEHLAARVEDRTAGGARIRLGMETPAQSRMIEQLHEAGGNMNVRAPVAPAGLNQHYSGAGIFAQPVGEHAASRARADDHIVGLHCASSSPGGGVAAAAIISPSIATARGARQSDRG